MSYINKYLRNFKPYKVASHKIWRVSQEEKAKILKLDWNESTIQPSPLVNKRLKELVETNFINYYPETYNEHLYELLSRYTGLPQGNIQYFASSDSLHEYISKMYISVGDPVLILWPSYDNFRLTAQVAGAYLHFFELNNDFSFNKNAFEETIIRKSPSLVYICNPNNPTGLLIEKKYIESLLIKFPNTVFLVDEAYIEFCPNETCSDLVLKYNNLLISRTMSKAFGLANIRFGYLIASVENIDYISSIRNPKNITTFAQEAAIGVLEDVDYMRKYVQMVNEAKEIFINKINKYFSPQLKAYNSSANFVLVDCFDNKRKADLLVFLENNDIFVRNVGQSESVRKCVRITIGTKEQMERVINCIKLFFAL